MKHYRSDTFIDPRYALYHLSQVVLMDGVEVSPRGMRTFELEHVTIQIEDTTRCLAEGMGRQFNSKLAAYEVLSLLGGFASAELANAAAPNYTQFTGGGMTGAYGPRIRQQMPLIIDALRNDPDTRQAVVAIWDPARDLFKSHGDRPCTTQIGFIIRGGRLVTNTMMRSQDIFLGFTYDLVMFSQLHQTVANVLGIEAGPLIHQVRSLHAYERDIPKIDKIVYPPTTDDATILRGLEGGDWDAIIDEANYLAFNVMPKEDEELRTETEVWLNQQMVKIQRKLLAHDGGVDSVVQVHR